MAKGGEKSIKNAIHAPQKQKVIRKYADTALRKDFLLVGKNVANTTAKAVKSLIIRLITSFIGGKNITKEEIAPTTLPKTILRYLAFKERNFRTDSNSIKSIMKFTQKSMSMYITLCKKITPDCVYYLTVRGLIYVIF